MSKVLTITAHMLTEIVGDDETPIGVLVKNTGNIPVDAVRSIAQEALSEYAGGAETISGYRVQNQHMWREVAETTQTIYYVDKVAP